MARRDFFDGVPPASISTQTATPAEPVHRAAPLNDEHGTLPAEDVKSAQDEVTAAVPYDLRDDAQLEAFLKRTLRALERAVPEWMRDSAQDALTEAVVYALAHPGRVTSPHHLRRLAFRILGHGAGHRRRSIAGQQSSGMNGLELADPCDFRARLLAGDQLAPALAQLPEAYRRTLIAIKVLGLTADEHAAAEGIAKQTVHNRVHEATKRMRAILAQDAPS